MNKVICDICGTAYPDTAAKCPICGYAKTTAETTSAASERRSNEGYTAVKGGRFSKQNVRKRTSGKTPERSGSDRSHRSEKEEGGNTGLVLVVIFLLVAIVAVVIYIGLKVFNKPDAELPQPSGSSQVTQPSTAPSDPAPTGNGVACTELKLSNQTIEFVNAGDEWTLVARPTPANTTDEVTFESSAPSVVTVDETGLLTAVGSGEATITVTCGKITQTCQIKCSFETPSVPPTDPSTDPSAPTDPTGTGTTDATNPATQTPTVPAGPVDPTFTFEFNTKWKDETSGKWDTSILEQGKTWKAYTNALTVDPGAITWTTDDPTICTIQNGIVTGVAPGKTEVHATYGGKTYTCIVRCRFEVDNGGETDTDNDTDTDTGTVTGPFTISSEDMTIPVGEFWWLRLKDANGKDVEVTWTAEDGSIVSIDGNKIYGEKVGKTNVSTTYEGVTYTCIVRIKAAE